MSHSRSDLSDLSVPELLQWHQYLVELRPGQWWMPEGDQMAEYLATRAAVAAEIAMRGQQLELELGL